MRSRNDYTKKKSKRKASFLLACMCRDFKLLVRIEHEGILHAHACIRWTIMRGRIKSDSGKSKTRIKVPSSSKPFRLCFEYRTFLQKIFSMTKIWRFLRGCFTVDFSVVGFLGPIKTFKTQRQKVMFLYKSDFHWQSNAFLWFDFQTRGFTYQGGNAS